MTRYPRMYLRCFSPAGWLRKSACVRARPISVGIVALLLIAVTGCDRQAAKQRYFESGNRLYEQKKFRQAALAYRKALQQDGTFGEAYLRLGVTELQLRNPARAIAAFQRAVVLLRETEEPKVRLADTFLSSYVADSKRPQQLLSEVSQLSSALLERNPNSADGLRLAGHVALLKGDSVRAAELLRRSDSVGPLRPGVRVPLIQALFQSGQAAEGEQTARSTVAADHRLGPAWDLLIAHLLSEKRLRHAEAAIRDRVAKDPKNASVLLQLAGFYYSVGQTTEMEAALSRLRESGSQFPQGRLYAGDFYSRIGKPDDALREYRAGAAPNGPDRIDYQKRIATLLLARGDRDGAVGLYDAVLRQEPDNIDVLAARATVWSESGNPQKLAQAVQEFGRLIERSPDSPFLRFQLGRVYMRRGDIPGGRAQFEEAVRRQRWFVPARLALAETGIIEGRYNDALYQVNEALAVDARSRAARLLRATALTGLRSLMQARAELVALLRDEPRMVEAEIQMASVDVAEKKYAAAEETYRRLRSAGVGGIALTRGLVQAYTAQGKLDRAAEILRDELKRFPNSAEIRELLAENAVFSGRSADAVVQYRAASGINPASAELRFKLANALYDTGDATGAISELREACRQSPANAAYRLALGSILERTGQRAQAIQEYRSALAADSSNAYAMNNLAYNLADTGGDTDEAMKHVKRALEIIPAEPSFSDTLGWVYLKKGMTDAALHIFSSLLARNADNAIVRYHYAAALLQKGDRVKARTQLRAALGRKPTPEEARRIRELMQTVGG